MNRAQKRSVISVKQIEDLLGLPVMATIPNDYQSVSRALTAGKPVDANSPLGQEYHALAASMMDRKAKQPAPKTSKSIADYLSILPGKGSLFADKRGA